MIQLFDYQQEDLNKSKNHFSFAWFNETGTGKTFLALENIRQLYLEKRISAVIITAPKTVLRPVWMNALGEYYQDSNLINYYVIQWIGGLSNHQNDVVHKLLNHYSLNEHKLLFFIFNVEAFSHKRVYSLVHDIMIKWKTAWIIDESTTIMSPSAKRTTGILKIAHLAEYKRILSGYPVLKSPEDLYTQIQFLGPNLIPYRSFYAFRNEFCFTKQLDNRVTVSLGPRNTDKLQELIKPFSTRRLKSECLNLPEKIHTCRYIEMTKEQKSMYEQMKHKGYVTLLDSKKEVFATTLLTQLGKLHQIANGVVVAESHSIPCSKYKVLANLIQHELRDKQVVIWCCYLINIANCAIQLELEGFRCTFITGESSMKERDEAITLFKSGRIQLLISNPSILGMGQTLTESSYAVYVNNSFNLEHRIQSEDRLHRIGQKNRVTYIDLISEDTIEDKVLDMLEKKSNIGAQSLGDKWETWFN